MQLRLMVVIIQQKGSAHPFDDHYALLQRSWEGPASITNYVLIGTPPAPFANPLMSEQVKQELALMNQ